MLRPKPLLLLLTLLLSGLVSASVAAGSNGPRGELAFRDSDHKKLGKELAKYFEAVDNSKGIYEAFGDVNEQILKLEKKLKGDSALALVEDMKASFRHARFARYSDRVTKGKVHALESDYGKVFVRAPSKYSVKKGGPYPLVISIPDHGTSPEQHLTTGWTEAARFENTIVAAVVMPSDVETWGVLDPGGDSGVSSVMIAFGLLLNEFAVDLDRVYLVGHGAGAKAALGTAAIFPYRFAGLATRGAIDAVDATNFRNLPTLLIDGGKGAEAFHAQAEELGHEHSTLGVGTSELDMWTWMDETPRQPYPLTLSLNPRGRFSDLSYWIKVIGFDPEGGSSMEATADREANRIEITAENLTQVQILFNDEVVDMSRPITIVVNGEEHEQQISRNPRRMCELAYEQSDWGRVFTATKLYDVPVQ